MMNTKTNGRVPKKGKFTIGKYRITKKPQGPVYWLYEIVNTNADEKCTTPDNTLVFQAVPGYIRRNMNEREITDICGYQTESESLRQMQRERYTARMDLQNRRAKGIRQGLIAA